MCLLGLRPRRVAIGRRGRYRCVIEVWFVLREFPTPLAAGRARLFGFRSSGGIRLTSRERAIGMFGISTMAHFQRSWIMQRTGLVLERGNERRTGDFRLGKAWSMDFPVYSAFGSFLLRSSCGEQIFERLPSARTAGGMYMRGRRCSWFYWFCLFRIAESGRWLTLFTERFDGYWILVFNLRSKWRSVCFSRDNRINSELHLKVSDLFLYFIW